MKKLSSGRHKTQVFIVNAMVHNGDKYLHNKNSFWIDVEFLYEPALRFTEDEPGCDEYIELISAHTTDTVPFGDECEYYLTSGDNYMAMLSDEQLEQLEELILSQEKEERYSDPDNYRPATDERIRRELGWGLVGAYESDVYIRGKS